MRSMRFIPVLAVFAACGTPTLAQETVSRMYDLRDLAAVLPPVVAPAPPARVPVLSDIPLLGRLYLGEGGSGSADPAPVEPGLSPTDLLLDKLCPMLSMTYQELVEDVYFVDGMEDSHKKFASAISRVKEVYADRVVIEVACTQVDTDQQHEVGAAPPEQGEQSVKVTVVAPRQTPTPVHATRTTGYIAGWDPVVGDSAVGIQPQTATLVDGVVLEVRVTGTSELPRVHVRGTVSKADVVNTAIPSGDAASRSAANLIPGAALTIGLPHIQRRSLDTTLEVSPGQATVVGIVPGFEENTQIIVSVKVRELVRTDNR